MLKNILIHLDSSRQSASRLTTAMALAKRHNAHLTGLFVVMRPQIPTFIEAQVGSDILDAQIAAANREGKAVLEDFSKRAQAEGLQCESRMLEGIPVECLIEQGRNFDLIVVGQFDPDDPGLYALENMPDNLILAVGRPVLVIPYAGSFPVLGENIIVSWDGSRQASRALNDAMILLQSAKNVDVLSINSPEQEVGEVTDTALQLARHGVNAEMKKITTTELEAADMLLSRAADSGADLIVMGAYGHSRWREVVLGGFTRHMLAHMTVPVLMSN